MSVLVFGCKGFCVEMVGYDFTMCVCVLALGYKGTGVDEKLLYIYFLYYIIALVWNITLVSLLWNSINKVN